MQETTGIEYLLDYDGEEYTGEDGLTMRFEIKRCPVSPERPLGVKYSLTLHDEYGTRILGFDNAHAVKPSKKKPLTGNKFAYDHVHRTASDKGTPFEVATAEQLLDLFLLRSTRCERKGSRIDMKRTAKVGIMPEADFRNRMLAAARGERTRAKGEPKIWFSSMRSLAEVLSDKNRELVRLIAEKHPESVAELARETGRDKGNLTRTLQRLASYGIIELRKENNTVKPVAIFTEFLIAA